MAPSNIDAFFREKLAPIVRDRLSGEVPLPYLAVDECLNNREVGELAGTLVATGRVAGAGPLWVDMRQRGDGARFTVVGGVPRHEHRHLDYGRPVQGWSWPDRRVVEFLVAHFMTSDRIVLLTENASQEAEGLRKILHDEVKPLLLSYGYGRLGLLVLFKRGKADYQRYCRAVAEHLKQNDVEPGFRELRPPVA